MEYVCVLQQYIKRGVRGSREPALLLAKVSATEVVETGFLVYDARREEGKACPAN